MSLESPRTWPSMVERRSVRGWVYCSILVMSSAIALLMPLELRSTAVALNPAAFKSVITSKKNHAPPPIPCTSTTCCPAAVLATLELGPLISYKTMKKCSFKRLVDSSCWPVFGIWSLYMWSKTVQMHEKLLLSPERHRWEQRKSPAISVQTLIWLRLWSTLGPAPPAHCLDRELLLSQIDHKIFLMISRPDCRLIITSGVVLVLVATAADEPGSKVAVKQQPTTNRSTLV